MCFLICTSPGSVTLLMFPVEMQPCRLCKVTPCPSIMECAPPLAPCAPPLAACALRTRRCTGQRAYLISIRLHHLCKVEVISTLQMRKKNQKTRIIKKLGNVSRVLQPGTTRERHAARDARVSKAVHLTLTFRLCESGVRNPFVKNMTFTQPPE